MSPPDAYMHEDGERLRARFRDGDEAAFQRLLDHHVDDLRSRVARQIPAGLQRRIAPSDVIQETCILAFARRDDFEDRGEGSFGAWMRAIADRKLREEIRRHNGASKRSAAREVTRGARPDTSQHKGAGRTPSAVAVTSEETRRIRRAMAQLPEDHRTVIQLALEQGLPLREVAE
jgi:RNA polymerase sigma-70 factor (ECF subfamily)